MAICGSLLLVSHWVAVATGDAGPTHVEPRALLDVRDDPESRALVEAAAARFDEAQRIVSECLEKEPQGKLATVRPQTIGRAHAATLQLKRLAVRLAARGEPAGFDLRLRAEALRRDLATIVAAYRQLPGVREQIALQFPVFQNEGKRHASVLPQVERLAKRERWKAADEAFVSVWLDLEARAVWYQRPQYLAVMTPYLAPLRILDRQLETLHREGAKASLEKLRQEHVPDFSRLMTSIRVSTNGNGELSWKDQEVGAETALATMLDAWREVHWRSLRCRAYDWARGIRYGGRPPNELDQVLTAHRDFAAEIGVALSDWVRAETARTPAADAGPLYVATLAQLAPRIAWNPDDPLVSLMAAPLSEMANRSPPLAAEVAAYRLATDDLLRWRRRTAAAYHRHAVGPGKPLAGAVLEAARGRNDLHGLVPARAADSSTMQLADSVADVFPGVVERLLGQAVEVADVAGLPAKSHRGFSRYAKRCYAQVALPDNVDQYLDFLREDLLVNEQMPPLTLDAALTLARAEHGDYRAVGGTIAGVFLESLVTRFATLPKAGLVMAPTGSLPREPQRVDPLAQVMVRVALEPTWIWHECFFADLAPGEPP